MNRLDQILELVFNLDVSVIRVKTAANLSK